MPFVRNGRMQGRDVSLATSEEVQVLLNVKQDHKQHRAAAANECGCVINEPHACCVRLMSSLNILISGRLVCEAILHPTFHLPA